MDSSSPINRMPSFERGDRLDGRKLTAVSRAINRMNNGISPPQQQFNNAQSASQVVTPTTIIVDAVAIANVALTGLQTIDGISLTAGMLVLLTAQTTVAQNGVYKVSAAVTGWKKNTPLQVAAVAAKTGNSYGLSWWLLTATNVYKQILSGGSTSTIVKAASTANLTLSGTQTIDGVACGVNDLVLAKDQTDATQNGVYKVAAGAWTKQGQPGAFVQAGGTANANTAWYLSATNTYASVAVIGVFG